MYDDYDDAYEEGYDEGYDEGYCDGHDDSRKGSHSQGCYVATCVYGSYDCPEVWALRRFRDGYLKAHTAGRVFIRCYYAVSPWCVTHFGKYTWFRIPLRKVLNGFVQKLRARGYSDQAYQDS